MLTRDHAIATGSELITDVTSEVSSFVSGQQDGLVHVFVPHATAGLALIETGSGTEDDLATTLDRILPVENIYRHRHGSTGHGRDHVLPAFVSPSLTIPVDDGRLALGTWQSIVIVDTNVDNRTRTLRLSFIPG